MLEIEELIESKSQKSYTNTQYNFLYDHHSNTIIGGGLTTLQQEISKCDPINNFIEECIGGLSQADLELFLKGDGKDNMIKNKYALSLFDRLQMPNCFPSPQNWQDILSHIVTEYFYNGISALVFEFQTQNQNFINQNLTDNEFVGLLNESKNIPSYCYVAKTITYSSINNTASYNIALDINQGMSIQFKVANNLIYRVEQNKILMAVIFGNYNTAIGQYITPLDKYKSSIYTYNYIKEANQAFYQNSCRPSSIVTIGVNNSNADIMSNGGMGISEERFNKVLEKFKTDFRGSKKTGGTIIVDGLSANVDIKTLSTPVNAEEIDKQFETHTRIIYMAFEGASKTALDRESKYNNNAIEHEKGLYNGFFSFASRTIISKLTSFMKSYLLLVDPKSQDWKNVYFQLNKNNLDIYKRDKIKTTRELFKDQLIPKNEGRAMLVETDQEEFASLVPLPEEQNTFYNEKTK